MKMRIFLFLFFLNSFIIWGQKVKQIDINAQQDFFWQQKDNHLLRKDYKNILLDSFYLDDSIYQGLTKVISRKKSTYIISIAGGMVWEIVDDTIVRIDNSYNHKLTYDSNVFVHNDTIFKFGGYGYWSSRNFLSFFSHNSNEWEFYPLNPRSSLPPGLSRTNFSYDNNLLFLSGGIIVDPHDGISPTPSNDIWRFDFNLKKWSNLGTSNLFEYNIESSIDIGDGRRLVANDPSAELPFPAYILDFNENQILPMEGLIDFPIAKSFYFNDSIYSIQDNSLIKRSLSSFKPVYNKDKSLYVDSASLFKSLSTITIIALVIMITILIALYSKNKRRPKLTVSGLRFERIHYPLPVKEHKVLSLLVHNKTVNSKALMKSIYDPELSVPQNNRIKLEVINSLNEKLSKIFSIDEFVSFRKSRKDQRMIIYYTNYRSDFVL